MLLHKILSVYVIMESDVKKWLKEDGVIFVRDLGIKKGQVILCFWLWDWSRKLCQHNKILEGDKSSN
jgi:hypothetical protein